MIEKKKRSLDRFRLDGLRALVSGAGRGLGHACALALAEAGAEIIALSRTLDELEKLQLDIQSDGGTADIAVCDAADPKQISEIVPKLGQIDILVNNAGISHVGNVETTTEEDLDRVYAVNIKGIYTCSHAVVPVMKKQGGGCILNMASIASLIGLEDRFAYSMSKGAVLTMTLSVAKDYVDKGIRCNCICPARVHTPFVDGYLSKNFPGEEQQMFDKLSAYQPIGRMGKPEEVAALAAFLCSDEASFITGAAYTLDGGVTSLI